MGWPPSSPPWLLSDGYQCYTFHHLHMLCKWQPPGTAISSHLVMGVGACVDAMHVCPTQILYKRGVHHTPMLTFQLTMGWDTSCTTRLPMGAAECLIHINKEIFLVTLYFCPPI